MPKANSPVGAGEPLEAPQTNAAAVAWERRVSEQLIADWEGEARRPGHTLARMTLDVSALTGPRWAHRFIIAVNPVIADSCFLLYGVNFAALMGLPGMPDYSIPMAAQLPTRYVPVFTRGCITSTFSSSAVRTQGAVEHDDGRQELYRAAFIRLSLNADLRRHFTLGAFNRRVIEQPI
jgi:hypothetical protein